MFKDSLRKGLEILRGSIPLVIVLFVYQAVSMLFMTHFVTIPTQQGLSLGALPLWTHVVWVMIGIAAVYVHAGTIGYVRDKISSEKATLSSFFSSGLKYFLPLILFSLAYLLIFIGILIGLALIFLLIGFLYGMFVPEAPTPSHYALVGALFAALTMISIICLTFFLLYAPTIIVVEDSKIFAAIKRSASIVRKSLKNAFGLGVLTVIAGLIISAISSIGGRFLHDESLQTTFAILAGFFSAFFGIYVTSVIMNIYLKLRAHSD